MLWICLGIFRIKINFTSDHHFSQTVFVDRLIDIDGADITSATDDRTAIGDLHDLFQFMRDQDDRFAFFNQTLHDLNEFLNLLWRQYSGRLVKNQDLSAPIERLQNFNTLLHPDRDIFDFGIRINAEAVLFRDVHHFFTRRGPVDRQSTLWL